MTEVIILNHEWEPTGMINRPAARLLATITLNGYSFHVEAFEVKKVKDGVYNAADNIFEEEVEAIYTLAGNDCPQRMEIKIDGVFREYFVVMHPFC